jgi:hypothetical protein
MSVSLCTRLSCFVLVATACIISPRSSAAGFRFVVWADATDLLQYVVTNAAQIRQLTVQPAFTLVAGDLYDTGFNVDAAEALRNAVDGDGVNALSGKMFPVRGNHDTIGGTDAVAGWQTYSLASTKVSAVGGSNYVCMPGCDSLTYSFDYQNSHFVGLDIPGDVTLVQSDQLAWLDADLAAAEARSMSTAFLWWHGPVYSCGNRHGGVEAPAGMVAVLNKHPIVSAVFGGHAHVFAWTHMYTNRISTLTDAFEAFIVPPIAESLASLDDTNRCDYGLGDVRGFTAVDVDGPSFTVSLYVQDRKDPAFTRTFPRAPLLSSAVVNDAGQFMFHLQGEPGCRYRIEGSQDRTAWFSLSTNTVLSAQGNVITNLLDTNSPRQFYRGVWSP